MRLKSIYLTLIVIAFSLTRAAETGNDDDVTIINLDSFVDITDSLKVPNFTYNFHSYDCLKELSTEVVIAVNGSIAAGRFPILVSDIDETLVKKGFDGISSTDLYNQMSTSGVFSNSHGVLALTARPINMNKVVESTNFELATYAPEFYKVMRSDKNFDGISSLNLLFKFERRFIYDSGLLVMGGGGLSKRQVLDEYFRRLLINSEHKYDLIFIDDEYSWFQEFCTGGYNQKIRTGHFFHYNWLVGEGITPKKEEPSQSVKIIGRFTIEDISQDQSDNIGCFD